MRLGDHLEAAAPLPLLVQCRRISPVVAARGGACLPDTFHRGASDRIVVAPAREHDATLVRDERIIDAGLVPPIV